ncbi:MAG: hypothetical protein ACKVSF_15205 [Alphaproteobacteria bacterium]
MLRRLGPVLIAAVGGIALVWLSVPRLAAQIHSAPHDQILRDLQTARPDAPVSGEAVRDALKGKLAALAWLDDPRIRTDLGALELLGASTFGYDTPTGRTLIDRAIESHVRGLSRDPAQPYAWTRLAIARLARDGMSPELNALLKMAIATAPREPQLVLERIDLALTVWQTLDNGARAMVYGQIVIAAEYYERRLAQIAKRHHALPILLDALKDDERMTRRVGFLYRRV